jgi:hypothetical protein
MESVRRISPTYYMNFGIIRGSAKLSPSGIIDASRIPVI